MPLSRRGLITGTSKRCSTRTWKSQTVPEYPLQPASQTLGLEDPPRISALKKLKCHNVVKKHYNYCNNIHNTKQVQNGQNTGNRLGTLFML